MDNKSINKVFTSPRGIGLNRARYLAQKKREASLKSGQPLPVAHMAGSFGYK